jgi:metallo-beta-lactamase family protein
MDTKINVQFLGGVADADGPTGSCILLEVKSNRGKEKYLVDAGMIQCRFRESLERNLEILKWLKPSTVDAIILTHAHIDHSGRIPLMVKNGFTGKVICTEETKKLLPIMLEDNVKIHLSEAAYRRKKLNIPENKRNLAVSETWLGSYDKAQEKEKTWKRYIRSLNEPLYEIAHVEKSCALAEGAEYEEWIKIGRNVDLKFYRSGHILGGAVCVFKIKTLNGFKYLGFTGDLGREDGLILPPPQTPKEPIDFWFTESTYGGRIHPPREQEIERMMGLIRDAIKNKKKIIIPSFALERTQEIIYLISKEIFQGQIPRIPIYLDSPMAEKITEVFSLAWSEPEIFKEKNELPFNPFNPWQNRTLKPIEDQNESQVIMNKKRGPHIIIAGSGMCDAGRIRGYLRRELPRSDSTICLIGYMAEGSLGRKLKERWPIIRMNGQEIHIKARIESFDSFSAHADGKFLCQYAKKVMKKSNTPFKKLFIVHGEKKGALDLKVDMIKTLNLPREIISIPRVGENFEI